jgi:hypothetical protein
LYGIIPEQMNRDAIDLIFTQFAEFLIQEECILPSVIMTVYSQALLIQKLFIRDVVGLKKALGLVRKHRKMHIKVKDNWLIDSTEFSRYSARLLARICELMDMDLRDAKRKDYQDASHLPIARLAMRALFRPRNCANINVSDEIARFPMEVCIRYTPNNESWTKIAYKTFEKPDRLTGNPVPARTITSYRKDVTTRGSTLHDVFAVYAKFHRTSVYNLSGPLTKPKGAMRKLLSNREEPKGFNPISTAGYREWLQDTPAAWGMHMPSLNQHHEGNMHPKVLRACTMTAFCDNLSLIQVMKLAGHKSVNTTAKFYCGLTDAESDKMRLKVCEALLRLSKTEKPTPPALSPPAPAKKRILPFLPTQPARGIAHQPDRAKPTE